MHVCIMYVCVYVYLYMFIYTYICIYVCNFKLDFTDITYLRILGGTWWYGLYILFQKKPKHNNNNNNNNDNSNNNNMRLTRELCTMDFKQKSCRPIVSRR